MACTSYHCKAPRFSLFILYSLFFSIVRTITHTKSVCFWPTPSHWSLALAYDAHNHVCPRVGQQVRHLPRHCPHSPCLHIILACPILIPFQSHRPFPALLCSSPTYPHSCRKTTRHIQQSALLHQSLPLNPANTVVAQCKIPCSRQNPFHSLQTPSSLHSALSNTASHPAFSLPTRTSACPCLHAAAPSIISPIAGLPFLLFPPCLSPTFPCQSSAAACIPSMRCNPLFLGVGCQRFIYEVEKTGCPKALTRRE